MNTMTSLQSSFSTTTRPGLIGGVVVGNLTSSQRSQTAELAARRREMVLELKRERQAQRHARRAARRHEATTISAEPTSGVSRWAMWLPSGLRHRSSGVPQNSNACVNC